MAELVDAADSKSAVRKDVQVRFLFWARDKTFSFFEKVFYLHKSAVRKDLSQFRSGFWYRNWPLAHELFKNVYKHLQTFTVV